MVMAREILTGFILMFGIQATIGSYASENGSHVCRRITTDLDIKNLILKYQHTATPCACFEQKMALDYSFQKIGNCYKQWFSENGLKQMCCYDQYGSLLFGPNNGGYLIPDILEPDIEDIHNACCKDSDLCEMFYKSFLQTIVLAAVMLYMKNRMVHLYTTKPKPLGTQFVQGFECILKDYCYHDEMEIKFESFFSLATSWGDPEITTVGQHTYSFNGHGEYTFLETQNKSLQIQAQTDFFIKGNKDATVFVVFVLADNIKKDTITIVYQRTNKTLSLFKHDGSLWANSMNCKRNPEPSRKLGYGFLLFCSTPFSFGIVLTQKTSIQRITFSGGDFMSVTFQSKKNVTGFRGLAGNLEHGYYIYRNGSKASINATERDFFYFGESWTVSQKDSKFNYKITGGIFTYWNGNHTRPQFLQEIAEKGDLDKLFEGFSDANITKFNETCRNSWDKKPNIQCLVIIAKTKNVTQGESVMAAAEEKHHIYEINHNKPPQFKNNTPTVLNVTFGLNSKILDLKLYVTDDFDDPEEMTYNVVTKLKNYTFNNGSFTWNVGTYLRYSDSSLTFTVNDTLGSPAARQMIIYYCGCENPSQCDFSSFNKNSSETIQKAACKCPAYSGGLYCEVQLDPCKDCTCYENNCNGSFNRNSSAWPCADCPEGRTSLIASYNQTCENINECEVGPNPCGQICNDTDGSYKCFCEEGFTLNIDGHKCDEGSTYIGHMAFTISATIQDVSKINKTINSDENRKDVQDKLAEGFKNTKGFLSVEVFRLRVVIHQGKRPRRDAGQYDVRADYVVHWKNVTDIKTIGEKLLDSFRNFTSQNRTQKNLKIGNVDINLLSAENHINNATTEGGLCLVPGKTDCAPNSTHCIDKEHGEYECQCKNGYSPAYLNKKYCSDINECDAFKKNRTIGERCVHGSCYNSVGSWNCSCPAGRQWQDVGNATFPVYRCQGNFSYIGNLSILWRGQSSRETIVNSIQNQLKIIYTNDTLEDTTYRLPMSSLFVSATVLSLEEDRSVSPMHLYTVMYNLRMGEHVGRDRVSNVLKTMFNGGSLLIRYTQNIDMTFRNTSYYIFRDSDNILCNLTSNGNCDPATTDCQQQNGTTFCKCKDGYEKLNPSEKFCIDIDECVEKHMNCSGHGKCKNTREGYTCVCTEGYIMNRTDPYNVSCNDIDECNSRNYTCKNGSCSNTDGNWNCICPSLGFWRNEFSKNVVVCEDINECSDSSYFCGGECNNTFGSWTCDCGTGYQSHPNKTKYASNITCDDIDECAENKTDCSGHGNCKNILGDYTCDCDTGFILNEINKSCDDIDECSSSSYFCGGKCNNTFGSWACDCGTGYQSHPNKTKYASNITCEDIDECTENKIDCSGHGNCTNVPGCYICVCDTGFIFNETNKSCEDIDECQSPNYTCGGGGNCSNTDGNWTCSCPAFGYRPHEYSENAIVCEDIDECSDSTYYCGGTCNNTLGNWTCECDTGYTRESNEEEAIITCEDINECDNKESCIDGVCRNQDGSWTCKCPDGKKPKTINSTTILCSGGYVYIATIGIAVTGPVGNKDPELKVYLETQIKTAYESKYPEHNVRVEIISISKGSTDRKKRQTSENLAVEFVLHFDEPLESENITNAWQDYRKESCPKGICKAEKNDIAVDLPFNVIFEEDVVFEEDKQTDELCKIPKNNLCNPDSTKCQYINATLNCECKKGYTRKSDYECKVTKNTCNENPCQNDGSCHMINADTDFECRCRDGWTGKTCEDVQKIIVKSAETDLKTIFIATGSSLGAVVFILAVVVIAVCRWKAAKVKEVEKMSMRNMDNNDFRSFDGSLMNSQYMRDGQNFSYDRNSLNSYRSLPYEQQNGGSSYRNHNGYFNGSAYAKPHKLPRPHFHGSMPNLANNDAHFYRSDTRRYSGEEPRRVLSYDQGLDSNYDMNWRAPRNKLNSPRSPSPDYGRPSSPRPDYGRREKLNRSKDSGVGNGYSSGSNEYRRPEKRREYYYGNRRSTNF